MTTAEQQINSLRLEIILSEVMVKLAMSAGVVLEDIDGKKIRLTELTKKLNDLLAADKIKCYN